MARNIEGYIDNKNDLWSYTSWILGEVNDWQSSSIDLRPELTDSEVEGAFEEVRSMVDQISADFEEGGSPDDVHSLIEPRRLSEPYNRVLAVMSEESQDRYSWGMWKSGDTELTVQSPHIENFSDLNESDLGKPVGYSDVLQSSILLHNSALIQHCYTSRPPELSWSLKKVNQGEGFTVYFGCEEFRNIDAVSKVPWINPRYESHKFASKAMNGSLSEDDEWQRLVDIARVHQIRAFAHGPDNYMVNPTLLYADTNHDSIEFDEKECVMTINFDFLGERSGLFYDFLPYPKEEDRRPLWIVDGQHRIRGFGSSPRGSMLDAPFIMIVGKVDDESKKQVAKIFTEINTTARALDKMHQTYLRYEFAIESDKSANDYEVVDGRATEDSRPNRASYRMALELAADSESPLYNSIQFQDPAKSSAKLTRMKRHIIIKSTNWMQISKSWFRSGGIYDLPTSDEYSTHEVKNFFSAFAETCNHTNPVSEKVLDWDDGRDRWSEWEERKKKKPIIQQQGPFRAVLHMVDFIVNKVKERNPSSERPFTTEQFKQVMSPLSNIDWLDEQKLAKLKGRGNLSVPHLRMWMEEAIREAVTCSVDDVMSINEESIAGKGICAGPSNDDLAVSLFADSDAWPGQLPLQVSMHRPQHSLRPSWGVECMVDGKNYTINVDKRGNAFATYDDRRSVLSIKKEALRPGTEAIRISGRWSNGIDDAIADPLALTSP